MGENTGIAWCHHTHNGWLGCTKVSEACRNCYAETLMDTRWGRVEWGPRGARKRTSEANWRKPLQWDRKAAAAGERRRVFCFSLADVFEGPDTMPAESWPIVQQARRDLLELIHKTQHLDWLLLTKRPENVLGQIHDAFSSGAPFEGDEYLSQWLDGKPPHNVWIGTSVENQEAADERIPHLLKIPAVVRFLSCEPLLSGLDLQRFLWATAPSTAGPWTLPSGRVVRGGGAGGQMMSSMPAGEINWVIAGAESLGKREGRPMDLDWVRSLRDQSTEAGVPFFLKQAAVDGKIVQLPELDGRTWSQFPEGAAA